MQTRLRLLRMLEIHMRTIIHYLWFPPLGIIRFHENIDSVNYVQGRLDMFDDELVVDVEQVPSTMLTSICAALHVDVYLTF